MDNYIHIFDTHRNIFFESIPRCRDLGGNSPASGVFLRESPFDRISLPSLLARTSRYNRIRLPTLFEAEIWSILWGNPVFGAIYRLQRAEDLVSSNELQGLSRGVVYDDRVRSQTLRYRLNEAGSNEVSLFFGLLGSPMLRDWRLRIGTIIEVQELSLGRPISAEGQFGDRVISVQ